MFVIDCLTKIRWLVRAFFFRLIFPNHKFHWSVRIGAGTVFGRRNTIELSREFYCGPGCYFTGRISVGERVLCGANVGVVGGDHKVDGVDIRIKYSGRAAVRKTVIADDVWIGHGAILLNGVTVGRGAVIGAGSVVTKDVEPLSIVVGNPARFIRFREDVEGID